MRRTALTLSLLAGLAASSPALTADQLTPQEKQLYLTVKDDPAAAKNFLDTREYVRQAKAVVGNAMRARDLPKKPKGFDARFLLSGEKDIVNEAITLSLAEIATALWT